MKSLIILLKWDEEIIEKVNLNEVILIYDEYDRAAFSIPLNKFYATFFINNFNALDEIDAITNEIINLNVKIKHIISLTEYSQYGAGYLSDKLKFSGLSMKSIRTSRNKYLMKKMVNELGIQTAKYIPIFDINNQNQLLEAVKQLHFPLVIKPMNGMGSDNTVICHNKNDILKYQCEFLAKSSQSRQLIIEEYITGDEYHADAIINAGKLRLLAISKYMSKPINWKNSKCEYGFCLDHQKYKKLYAEIRSHVLKMYNNMNLSTVIIHYEFFIDPTGKVIFSEFATRVGGGPINRLIKNATQNLSIKELYWKLINSKNSNSNTIYPANNKYYAYVNVRPNLTGKIVSMPTESVIKKLPHLVDYLIHCKINTEITRWGIIIFFYADSLAELRKLAKVINDKLLNIFKVS